MSQKVAQKKGCLRSGGTLAAGSLNRAKVCSKKRPVVPDRNGIRADRMLHCDKMLHKKREPGPKLDGVSFCAEPGNSGTLAHISPEFLRSFCTKAGKIPKICPLMGTGDSMRRKLSKSIQSGGYSLSGEGLGVYAGSAATDSPPAAVPVLLTFSASCLSSRPF